MSTLPAAAVAERFVQVFFEGDNMKHTLVALCQNNHYLYQQQQHETTCSTNSAATAAKDDSSSSSTLHLDPISHVLAIMLSCPLNLQLLASGLQPFRGKNLVIPYQSMTNTQREFLLDLLHNESYSGAWHQYELSMTWKQLFSSTLSNGNNNNTNKIYVDHLHVLRSLCELIQASKKYSDPRSRLAICNIILQRVHSHVGISKPVQMALNKCLFEQNNNNSDKDQHMAAACASSSAAAVG